jgi:16S rRNA (cytosine967-C5)-methyltransferase
MKQTARLQATLDLLTEINTVTRPADALMSAYFRARRYIGAKDRAAIAEHVYTVLRRWGRLSWWVIYLGQEVSPRTLLLADLVINDKKTVEDLGQLFTGEAYDPAELSHTERAFAKSLQNRTPIHPEMSDAIQFECPDWAYDGLKAVMGDRFQTEMQALLTPAPMDLRVNRLKGSREDAERQLRAENIDVKPCPFSPVGLRVKGRPGIMGLDAYKDGLIEIQDEGSQLVGAVCQVAPGHRVVDFCAGAGGKTLALAAEMNNKGKIIACDVLDGRLKRAAERFRRAGVHMIETKALSSERDPWVKRHKGSFDRVLVDAPCSGTGTWRRNPDARWRSLGPGLDQLLPLQASILDSASRLVKAGGRLIYATCSLLPQENEDQVAAFLASHPDFRPVPLADFWSKISSKPVPCAGDYLRLSPARHATDGFFAAVLEKLATKDDPAEILDEDMAEDLGEDSGQASADNGRDGAA